MDTTETTKTLMNHEIPFETSESITKIAMAMSTFQTKVEPVKKTEANTYFKSKYAPLENIIDAIKKPMEDAKLSYVQMPFGTNKLVTILMHESGEFFKSIMEMAPKSTGPQDVGSAITYYRRYALSAMLGIATEEDDDGNKANGNDADRGVNTPPRVATPPATPPKKTVPTAPPKKSQGMNPDLFTTAKKNLQNVKTPEMLLDLKVKFQNSKVYSEEQKQEVYAIIEERLKEFK